MCSPPYQADLRRLVADTFPPELQRLLHGLRVALGVVSAEDSDSEDGAAIDQERFVRLVGAHQVAPVLRRALQAGAFPTAPAPVRAQIRSDARANGLRAMALARELIRLTGAFETHAVPMLALKGPALALQLYGDLTLRHAGDLDILIRPEDAGRVESILRSHGYRNGLEGLPADQQTRLRNRTHDWQFIHETSRQRVEIHIRLTGNPHRLPLTSGECLGRSASLSIAGGTVPVPAWDDNLLYLLVHGASHDWYRLFWLVDVAMVVQQGEAQDWPALLARAQRLGVERMVAQGLVLMELLLGVPIPAPIREDVGRIPGARPLIRHVCRRLCTEHLAPVSSRRAFATLRAQLRCRSDLRYRLEEIGSRMISRPDMETLRLPDRLFPLYYVLRPFLWLWRRRNAPTGTGRAEAPQE